MVQIHLEPVKVDLDAVGFDDEHINNERNHNVTIGEAKQYIANAVISVTVWGGGFERYYGHEGTVYLNKNNLQIRTAYRKEGYNQNTSKIVEVLKKYGR